MTSTHKRNIANALMVLGLVPALLWLGLFAISGGLMPWNAAGIIWLGVPLCFLSLMISGSAYAWTRVMAPVCPEIWRGVHRAPTWMAGVISGLVICAVVAINLPRSQPSSPVQFQKMTPEENAAFERQATAKIEEMTGKPYEPAESPPSKSRIAP